MVKFKRCSKCKKVKPIKSFAHRSSRPGGFRYQCKECDRLDKKKWNLKNPNYSREYKRRDWQGYLKKVRAYRRTYSGYYTCLRASKKAKRKGHEVLISREKFIEWSKNQKRVCYYCGIPEELMAKLSRFSYKRSRGKYYLLTIDRKDNNKPYIEENIVLACPVCNRTKGRFFNYKEFKELAQNYIRPKWER